MRHRFAGTEELALPRLWAAPALPRSRVGSMKREGRETGVLQDRRKKKRNHDTGGREEAHHPHGGKSRRGILMPRFTHSEVKGSLEMTPGGSRTIVVMVETIPLLAEAPPGAVGVDVATEVLLQAHPTEGGGGACMSLHQEEAMPQTL